MKKTLLSLMTVGATIAPIATVVACGSTSKDPLFKVEKNDAYEMLKKYEEAIPNSEILKSDVASDKHHVMGSTHILETQKIIHSLVTTGDVGTSNLPDVPAANKHDFEFTMPGARAASWMKYATESWSNATVSGTTSTQFNDYAAFKTEYDALTADDKKKVVISGIQGTNLIYKFEAKTDAANKKDIVIGAHYDLSDRLVGTKSNGTNCNNSGVSTVISIANHLKDNPLEDYNVIIAFWDAEETGLKGSKKWVEAQETAGTKDNIEMYINIDSNAGGDYIYMGYGAFYGVDTSDYFTESTYEEQEFSKTFYNNLLAKIAEKEYMTHGKAELRKPLYREQSGGTAEKRALGLDSNWDSTKDPWSSDESYTKHFSEGAHSPWGDHSRFTEKYINALSIETTNYEVFGSNGRDGYSQTANPYFWYTSTDENNDVERNKDKVLGGVFGKKGINDQGETRTKIDDTGTYTRLAQQGHIWHNGGHDNRLLLERVFGVDRIKDQMNYSSTLVIYMIENFKTYAPTTP